jgi:hypothetical protein
VDFGFAEFSPEAASLTGVMGSPLYMAPEIWAGFAYGECFCRFIYRLADGSGRSPGGHVGSGRDHIHTALRLSSLLGR